MDARVCAEPRKVECMEELDTESDLPDFTNAARRNGVQYFDLPGRRKPPRLVPASPFNSGPAHLAVTPANFVHEFQTNSLNSSEKLSDNQCGELIDFEHVSVWRLLRAGSHGFKLGGNWGFSSPQYFGTSNHTCFSDSVNYFRGCFEPGKRPSRPPARGRRGWPARRVLSEPSGGTNFPAPSPRRRQNR